MSYNNKNLFDLLGNDVEDDTVENTPPPKEIVKKSTSSKKSDVAPASADPSRANKNRPKATGNDAAIKAKPNNPATEAPAPSAGAGATGKAKTDRKNKTGKTDSAKKLKKSWGDDAKELETELAAEVDAQQDLAAEGETLAEEPKNLKSVEEYFQELKLQQDQLSAAKPIRKVTDDGSSELLVKETEEFFPGSAKKSVRSKPQKSKKFLDIDAVFSDEVPAVSSGPRGGASRGRGGSARGGSGRGGASARGGRNGAARGGAAASAKVSNKTVIVDDTTFPSLS